jgi:anaerobic magnesium-protoporphyrin IX monomethyl ester cyclase
MRVGLIAPASPFLLDQAVHGPLGLWSLGAALRAAGHEPVYADMGLGDPLPKDCSVWCLTGTTPQRANMQMVADAATVPLIIGGPHASSAPDDALTLGGVVVVGEGDQVLPELLAGPIPRHAIIHADRIKDLDALPYPDRSQAGRYHYTLKDRGGMAHACATAITSRGCPHRCAFCSKGVWNRRYTARSAAHVLGEMAELRDAHGYEAVHFYDDSLALDRRRLKGICDGMRRLGMIWRCFVRADQMTAEIMQHMADCGCVEIGMGVESGSQVVLDAITKDETVEQQAQAIHWAHAVGIRVKAFIIVGLPSETWETIQDTETFLTITQPDDVDITVLQVYPGTSAYEQPDRYDLSVDTVGGWYKGTPGAYTVGHRTAALSANDLRVARDYLEARFKRWDA